MTNIISTVFRACFAILVLAGNSALAQNLNWAEVSDLSDTLQEASHPQIALSADGTKAIGIWYGSDGSNTIIQSASASISGNTATWSSVTNLTTTSQSARAPQIALSADGTKATAVWHRSGGSNIIQSASANISGNATTWSSVMDLSAAGQNAWEPQIGLSADGTKATVVWYRWSGSNEIVQSASASISGNIASWKPATNLSATGQDADSPQIGLSADGTKATAVWRRSDGSNNIVQSASANIIGNTATWNSATELSDNGRDADRPQIGLSADGTKATAVWSRFNGSSLLAQSASASISGNIASWKPATNLSATGQDADYPQIGLSADGTKATAVWSSYAGSNNIIQSASANIIANTAAWSATTNLTTTGKDAWHPQIALSSSGTKATTVWRRADDSFYWIIQSASASISGNSATWSSATELSTTGENAWHPQITLSSDGAKTTAVWRRSDGSNWNIQSVSALEDSSCYVIKSSTGKTVVFCL